PVHSPEGSPTPGGRVASEAAVRERADGLVPDSGDDSHREAGIGRRHRPHEIETYNELLPGPGELAATMLIEYPDAAHRDAALRRLLGLERHLWIVLAGKRERAIFDPRQMTSDRISSVQFVRFPVRQTDRGEFLALGEAGQLAIEV